MGDGVYAFAAGVYAFAAGAYAFAVFTAGLGVVFVAFVFAGFFVRARFFMARNLQ
jgi:hypothetical protein